MSLEERKIKRLVEASKQMDTDAFSQLYEMVYKDMYAYAYYMLNNQQDAEDAVADAVMAAFENIRKLRDAELFRNWIFKILSNQCKKKRKQYVFEPVELLEEMTVQEENVADKEDIRRAMQQLTLEEKVIVNSYLFGGFKGEEIAKCLGIKHSTVRSKYRRTLQKLQKYLQTGGENYVSE